MGRESRTNPFSRQTDLTLPPEVKDAFGRTLVEGDLVFLQVGHQQPFRVQNITPVMDPSAPANLMDILVTCTLKFRAVRGDPNQEFVRVLQAVEVPTRPAPKDDEAKVVEFPAQEPV